MNHIVGLIGLGNVGGKMARQLLDANADLHIYDLDAERTARLVEAGAIAHESPRAVATASDVVALSLPNTDVVDEVALGENGVLSNLRPGGVLIDMSTNIPDRAVALAAEADGRGVRMLDAPISFGSRGMVSFVGGERGVYEDCQFFFDAVSFRHYYVGGHGKGQYVKLIQNLLSGVNIGAVAEVVAFSQRAGIDIDAMLHALRWTGAYSGPLSGMALNMVARQYGSTRTLGMHVKDLNYVIGVGDDLGATMPFAHTVRDVFAAVHAAGDPTWNQTAVIEWFDPLPAEAHDEGCAEE